MVIMALDHVRDYFHADAYFFDPSDLDQTNTPLFWTRFITHFCAPVFVFLAGTSSYFVGMNRSRKELSVWLLKRGLWLVVAEITIIKLAWTFKLDYSVLFVQVIWALGIGMIALAGFLYIPRKWLIAICLIGVIGHNFLDPIQPEAGFWKDVWTILHVQDVVMLGETPVLIAYPLIPWIFVMPLGYVFGKLYGGEYPREYRIKLLYALGLGMCALFVLLRFMNAYGDPVAWESTAAPARSLLSFFQLTKYPPSLLYLLATLGPALLFLAWTDRWKLSYTHPMVVVGRVPMFFYIIHIYAIHFFALIAAILTGFSASDMVIDLWVTFQPELQGYGFPLWFVYLVWILVVLGLYPLCKWYDAYKRTHRQHWWLSYF